MKFFLSVVAIALLCYIVEFIMPWWAIAVVSFLVALFAGHNPGKSFVMGFCGVGLCWLLASFLHDISNNHILSSKMALLFHLPNHTLFMVVTVVIGGVVGGMAAFTGAMIKGK